MRLRDMQEIIKENAGNLSIEVKASQKTNGLFEISNPQISINALDTLSQFNFLDKEIEELKKLPHIYNNKSHSRFIYVDTETRSKFVLTMDNAQSKTIAVYQAISQSLPPQNELSISVKLPSNTTTLQEVTHIFRELETSFKLGTANDSIKVQAFDTGSFWIELIVDNKEMLVLLGQIINSATQLAKEYIKHKSILLTVSNLPEETLKVITDDLESQIKRAVQEEVKIISSNNKGPTIDAEQISRLEKSVESFAKLMSEGTTVTPALNAPEEAKDIFPEAQEFKEIDGQIKFIDNRGQKKLGNQE